LHFPIFPSLRTARFSYVTQVGAVGPVAAIGRTRDRAKHRSTPEQPAIKPPRDTIIHKFVEERIMNKPTEVQLPAAGARRRENHYPRPRRGQNQAVARTRSCPFANRPRSAAKAEVRILGPRAAADRADLRGKYRFTCCCKPPKRRWVGFETIRRWHWRFQRSEPERVRSVSRDIDPVNCM